MKFQESQDLGTLSQRLFVGSESRALSLARRTPATPTAGGPDANSADRIFAGAAGEDTWLFALPWALDDHRGVNQVVINLARSFRRRESLRPALLINDWKERELAAGTNPNGCETRYRRRPPVDSRRKAASFLGFIRELPSRLRTLRGFLRANRVAVVNSHYPGTPDLLFSLLRALRLARFRFILSVHGADVRNAKNAPWIDRILWRLLLSSADAIVACSEHLAGEVRESYPRVSRRVVAVHNGLDAGAFLASRDAAFQLPDRLRGVPYVLAVATFEHKKGLDVLVEAFARVSGQFPDLQLVLAGGEGPERPQIEALAAARGLAERIHIFVSVPHARIPAFMESARLFVLPSRIEPFGLVLVEAGAFSLPVIATRVGGIPEIIQHGVSGSLVRSEDPEDLASAIRESMSFPERAQSMGAALRESVSSRFSWDRAAEHYLRVAVAASGRRNRPAT